MDPGGIGGRGRRDQTRCYSCKCFANGYIDTTTLGRFRVDLDIITLVCDTLIEHRSECLF